MRRTASPQHIASPWSSPPPEPPDHADSRQLTAGPLSEARG